MDWRRIENGCAVLIGGILLYVGGGAGIGFVVGFFTGGIKWARVGAIILGLMGLIFTLYCLVVVLTEPLPKRSKRETRAGRYEESGYVQAYRAAHAPTYEEQLLKEIATHLESQDE